MIFSVTLPSDGTNADVRDYNDPIQQIIAGLNGQLDDNNIASLNGSKITANTLPEAALTDALKTGWLTQSTLPTSIVALGNRSYTVNYGSSVAGIKSPGMRNRFTRQTVVPNQSASLNGSNQYFVKTSPNKMTWTDDFSDSAWVKLTSYPAGDVGIVSRVNGTQGWWFGINSSGQLILSGHNGGLTNYSRVISVRSLPLNRWIHVVGQLDMSAFTATPTTSYTMFDGVDVPVTVLRAGTNPTTLVQAGNLEIGTGNAGAGGFGFFPGKIAQVAVYNAKVTQATHLSTMNQGLTGAETSLASGYSLSNSVLDLNTTTPNDLSVGGGSATTTNADSPFGNSGVSTTIEYGITMAVASNGLSETIQVPEGCAIPTSGSISALSYSTQKAPYLFPVQESKWQLIGFFNAQYGISGSLNTWAGTLGLTVPIGEWSVDYDVPYYSDFATGGTANRLHQVSLSVTNSTTEDDATWTSQSYAGALSSNPIFGSTHTRRRTISLAAATSYYIIGKDNGTGGLSNNKLFAYSSSAVQAGWLRAVNAYL